MKSFNEFMIQDYPSQESPKTGGKEYENPDPGDWVRGAPSNAIEGWEESDVDTVLSKASKEIAKSRGEE